VINSDFRIFPPERLEPEFPWLIWAVGWLALLKAFIWLAYEPVAAENVLQLMAYRNLLNIIPLVVFGIRGLELQEMGHLGDPARRNWQSDFLYCQSADFKCGYRTFGISPLHHAPVECYLAVQWSGRRFFNPLCSTRNAEVCEAVGRAL